jgi:hypothetical protein
MCQVNLVSLSPFHRDYGKNQTHNFEVITPVQTGERSEAKKARSNEFCGGFWKLDSYTDWVSLSSSLLLILAHRKDAQPLLSFPDVFRYKCCNLFTVKIAEFNHMEFQGVPSSLSKPRKILNTRHS